MATSPCTIVAETCKRAGERRSWSFDWTLAFANRWAANQAYPAATRVRPSSLYKQTGYEYESSGGQSSGLFEPSWGKTLGQVNTRDDGSIGWTARALSYDSLAERIDSVTLTAAAGVTLHPLSLIDQPGKQQTPFEVSGGTAGEIYDILIVVSTTAGRIYEALLRLEVE